MLALDAAKRITHSVVSSRLDYTNTLLHGTSATNLNKLQMAQNTLARVMCSVSTTELHRQPHWLSIHQQITYDITVITYKTTTTDTPAYLSHVAVGLPTRTDTTI